MNRTRPNSGSMMRLCAFAAVAALSVFAGADQLDAQQRSIINPSFEQFSPQSIAPRNYFIGPDDRLVGWESTNGTVEPWRSGFLGVPAHDGNYFVELNPSAPIGLYQEVCLTNGEVLEWSFWHGARSGGLNPQNATYEIRTLGGALVQSLASQNTFIGTGWQNNAGSVIFGGATGTYRLQFRSTDRGSYGNFLDSVDINFVAYAELSTGSGADLEATGGNMMALQVTGVVQTTQAVPFFITGGTATNGVDYTLDSATVTVPAGNYDGLSAASFIPLPITILDDGAVETDETIQVEVGPFSNSTLAIASPTCTPTALTSAVYTINDDDVAPVAQNDSSFGNTVQLNTVVDILGNDTDANGNATIDAGSVSLIVPVNADPASVVMDGDGDIVGFAIMGQGTWTVDETTGLLTFDPDAGFYGDPDVISYTVDDIGGNPSNPAIVQIDYDVPPIAQDDESLGNTVGDVVTISLTGNDTDGDGAIDPATVSLVVPAGVTLVGAPMMDADGDIIGFVVDGEGSWAVDQAGVLTFTPEASFAGDPTPITYTVESTDGSPSNAATVTIDYDVPPIAQNDAVAGLDAGVPVVVAPFADNGSGIDADSDGSIDATTVTLTLTGMPGDATLVGNVLTVPGEGVWTVDPSTGAVTFTPEAGFVSNPTPASYTVADNDGNVSNEAVITLAFTPLVPSIALFKSVSSVSDSNGNGVYGDAGDTVNFSFSAQNTGNTALAGIVVSDTDLSGLDGVFVLTQPVAGFDGDLAIGEGPVAVATASYVLAASDIASGGVTNTADVSAVAVATDAGGNPDPATPLVGVPPAVDDSDAGSDPALDRATGAVPPVADPAGTGTGDDPTILTLQPGGAFTLTKATTSERVLIGETVSYEIVATSLNAADFGPAQIVDTLPVGLAFVPGSATVDGVAVTPVVSGQTVTFSDLTLPANGDVTIVLQTRVLSSAPPGALTNVAGLVDQLTGEPLVEIATAVVSRTVESTFDCSPVIGKVFDDVNMDGYQDDVPNQSAMISNQDIFVDKLGRGGKLSDAVVDQGEVGLAGVRLVTPSGTVITTDAHGRYAVPCAEIPSGIGSNFMLKLDTRTLPSGYRVTTENPRVMRLTSGLMTEMNFGAALGRVFDVDLSARAYGGNAVAPSQALADGLEGVLRQIAQTPTVIRIAYYRDSEAPDLARARLDAVEDLIQEQWADIGTYRLLIEQTVMQLQ